MNVKSTGNTTSSSVVHPLNASFPIFIILSGNITFFNSNPLNASSAKDITTNPFVLSGTSNTSILLKSPDMYFSALASLFSNV